jgi:hypothetical protein
MIKPRYPKRADVSRIARLLVEHATGAPLTIITPRGTKTSLAAEEANSRRKKHQDTTRKTDR